MYMTTWAMKTSLKSRLIGRYDYVSISTKLNFHNSKANVDIIDFVPTWWTVGTWILDSLS